MERWFEVRQRVLTEFNIRAFGVWVVPLCSVWGVSEGIMGRECMGLGLRCGLCGPPAFPFQRLSFCAADTSSDKPLVHHLSLCVCVSVCPRAGQHI